MNTSTRIRTGVKPYECKFVKEEKVTRSRNKTI